MAAHVESVLIDLDGVIYQGKRPVAGARETLAWLDSEGIPHRFVTNTSSRPRSAIADKLSAMGIEVDPEEILAPPAMAAEWLRRHVERPVALFVAEGTRTEFRGIPVLRDDRDQGAGAVVMGDLGAGWDFNTLNRAFRLLMDEPAPPLVALGMTRYWQTENGLQLDVGPFVRALEYAAGAQSVVLGKPSVQFFQAALSDLGCGAEKTLMIGDDRIGDVEGAQAAGIRGVLVRTGKFRPEDLEADPPPPIVLDSIADLPDWLQGQ